MIFPESVLIYAGKGSSHSWVWLADLLEANGIFDASFVDAADFAGGLESSPSLVLISGGDGFEIAESLSGAGFSALTEYINEGGMYLGICAGAYLPLPARVEPFSALKLSETRVRNVRNGSEDAGSISPRLAVRYGSCRIFHPVRGEVVLGEDGGTFVAPIYGGPVFSEPVIDEPVLRYASFTSHTAFQVNRRTAEETMIGWPAVLRCRCGEGQLVLAGPHLEHPGYPAANDVFMRLAKLDHIRRCRISSICEARNATFLGRSLADLKVAILGAERESFILGAKQWDGSRMLELTTAIESRKSYLDNDTAQAVAILLDRSRESLLSASFDHDSNADSAPGLLVEAARLAVDGRFRAARDGFILVDSH
ncbi:MAG: hypothetical protein JSU93_04470 [Methanobacteriota archaeon]|nr:MAG: hypothetical protein JSU93_04470 [Euryarchaeota archaeon]